MHDYMATDIILAGPNSKDCAEDATAKDKEKPVCPWPLPPVPRTLKEKDFP